MAQETRYTPAHGPQLPQGPVFHEEPSEQPDGDMVTESSNVAPRVSGHQTESGTGVIGTNSAFILPESVLYYPQYPPPGSFHGQSIPNQAILNDEHVALVPPPLPPFFHLAPASSTPVPGTAPPLPIIFTSGAGIMPGLDSATPSTATTSSLPSAPPRTPEDGEDIPEGDLDGEDQGDSSVPRLPPILQVEKQQVTTSATQAASASRRRNEAHFVCPVPGCGSTFTRRFNLRGHLRSHTEERPYVCEWPGCGKGFARQHDCKRHQALHSQRTQANVCHGCKKTFSRLDALNRHLRSDGGVECRRVHSEVASTAPASSPEDMPTFLPAPDQVLNSVDPSIDQDGETPQPIPPPDGIASGPDGGVFSQGQPQDIKNSGLPALASTA